MAYGILKVDTVTFTDAGVDKSVSISGLVQNPTFSGNVTVTGTISGNLVRGQTVSGVTVTGTTATFSTGTFTSLTGTTSQGTTAAYTSGSFTSLTGVTTSGTTANFVSGVFSTQISGATITGNVGAFATLTGGVTTLTSGVFALGTASNPSISFTSDPNTGIYSPGADQVAISTSSSERLRITSDGKLGLGTSSPDSTLHVGGTTRLAPTISTGITGSNIATLAKINFTYSDTSVNIGDGVALALGMSGRGRAYIAAAHDGTSKDSIGLTFYTKTAGTDPTARLVIDPVGKVGVGTTSPSELFHVAGNARIGANDTSAAQLEIGAGATGDRNSYIDFIGDTTYTDFGLRIIRGSGANGTTNLRHRGTGDFAVITQEASPITFTTNSTERARIDSSGRLLVGTSTAAQYNNYSSTMPVHIAGTGDVDIQVTAFRNDVYSGGINFSKSRGTTVGANTLVANGDTLGNLRFFGADGSNWIAAGIIQCQVDGTPGANDMPGRIVFSTTADGASSPTERLRITSDGKLGLGTSSPGARFHVEQSAGASAITEYARLSSSAGNDAMSMRIAGYAYAGNARTAIDFIQNASSNFQSQIAFSTSAGADAIERVRIDSQGRVGVGTTSPSYSLHVNGSCAVAGDKNLRLGEGSFTYYYDLGRDASTGKFVIDGNQTGSVAYSFRKGGTSLVDIDNSGRLLVGTSSAVNTALIGAAAIQAAGGTNETAQISISRYSNNSDRPRLAFLKSRSGTVGTNTIVQDGDCVGEIAFLGADGSSATGYPFVASIGAHVDGTPGANDMPGRLVFNTTADGASSPTERARITNGGALKVTTTGSFRDTGSLAHELVNNVTNNHTLAIQQSSTAYAEAGGGMLLLNCATSASSSWTFGGWYSGNAGDREFEFRGDGNAFADGTWTGGGADYAEYFEWVDSNPTAEDRRGISVVLDGDKIREAQTGEDPIGVISGNPSVVGDAAWNKWSGKYLRDEFGTYIQEDYEVTDEDGNTVIQQRRKLNPAYDPDQPYQSREERPEWDCVGLMGKLRLRKGQITGSRWIKMRDISDSVEEWLVR